MINEFIRDSKRNQSRDAHGLYYFRFSSVFARSNYSKALRITWLISNTDALGSFANNVCQISDSIEFPIVHRRLIFPIFRVITSFDPSTAIYPNQQHSNIPEWNPRSFYLHNCQEQFRLHFSASFYTYPNLKIVFFSFLAVKQKLDMRKLEFWLRIWFGFIVRISIGNCIYGDLKILLLKFSS